MGIPLLNFEKIATTNFLTLFIRTQRYRFLDSENTPLDILYQKDFSECSDLASCSDLSSCSDLASGPYLTKKNYKQCENNKKKVKSEKREEDEIKNVLERLGKSTLRSRSKIDILKNFFDKVVIFFIFIYKVHH